MANLPDFAVPRAWETLFMPANLYLSLMLIKLILARVRNYKKVGKRSIFY